MPADLHCAPGPATSLAIARPFALIVLLTPAFAGCIGTDEELGVASVPDLGSLACPKPCETMIDDQPGYAWEPAVAVNPLDPSHILAGSFIIEADEATGQVTYWVLAHVSRDGGATWETSRFPGGPTAGPTHPLFAYNGIGDAWVGFLPDGTALFSGLALNLVTSALVPAQARTGYSAFVARSSDGGLTYAAEDIAIVAQGTGAIAFDYVVGVGAGALWDAHDKQWLAVGPDGTLLMAWTEILFAHPKAPESPLGRCDMVASSSADGGRTWSPIRLVAPGDCFGGASPAVMSDGTFRVAYFSYNEEELYIASSADQGETWEVQSLGACTWMPMLKVDRSSASDRLYLAYPERVDDDGRERSVVRWSDDGGATWTDPLVVRESEFPGQHLTTMDVAADGTALVAYFDPLGDEDDSPAAFHVASVSDGAVVSHAILDPDTGAPASMIGHYVGLVALPDGAYGVWTAPSLTEFASEVVGGRLARA